FENCLHQYWRSLFVADDPQKIFVGQASNRLFFWDFWATVEFADAKSCRTEANSEHCSRSQTHEARLLGDAGDHAVTALRSFPSQPSGDECSHHGKHFLGGILP